MTSRFVITKADESNQSLHGSLNGDEGSPAGDGSAAGTPSRAAPAPISTSAKGSPTSPPAILEATPASPPPTVTFSGVVEDERASINNSGDVTGGAANHRDYGSNVNSALLASPVSEPTNDTLDGLHLNNGYQDTIDSSMLEDDKRNLYLYAEEMGHRPQITSVIRQLANYQTAIPGEQEIAASKKTPEVAKLGTILGVYLPCIQNIFGVILFIRLIWVVGTAGSIQGIVIVGMSCCTTMLTAISLSAISTNGVVPGGGSYFMISRNLGPEFGGAVGILFYLATTFAAAMYILGAVEIFLMYMTEGAASLFGPIEKEEDKGNLLNNMRVMGSMLLCFSGTCVFIGVRFVSRLAPVALVCVLFSILSIYIGIVVNTARGGASLMICVLRGAEGDRVIPAGMFENSTLGFGPDTWCDRNNTILRDALCAQNDEEFCHAELGKLEYIDGIPGLNSPVFGENWKSLYRKVGNVLQGQDGNENIEVVSDITTNFALLLGLFFPSCTGIMAGSNRSGDLKDPSRSIPVGTIAAIVTTSIVYISSVFFYAGSVEGVLARDKFGLSVRKKLVIANLAWPNEWVILVGSLLSTVGAGLQSLVGAPRLLQAIAKDGIIPILSPLAASDKRGEPVRAILVTIAICEFAILDRIKPQWLTWTISLPNLLPCSFLCVTLS